MVAFGDDYDVPAKRQVHEKETDFTSAKLYPSDFIEVSELSSVVYCYLCYYPSLSSYSLLCFLEEPILRVESLLAPHNLFYTSAKPHTANRDIWCIQKAFDTKINRL